MPPSRLWAYLIIVILKKESIKIVTTVCTTAYFWFTLTLIAPYIKWGQGMSRISLYNLTVCRNLLKFLFYVWKFAFQQWLCVFYVIKSHIWTHLTSNSSIQKNFSRKPILSDYKLNSCHAMLWLFLPNKNEGPLHSNHIEQQMSGTLGLSEWHSAHFKTTFCPWFLRRALK